MGTGEQVGLRTVPLNYISYSKSNLKQIILEKRRESEKAIGTRLHLYFENLMLAALQREERGL